MNKAVLPLLLILILLGNGLRSVIGSTVFVSEGTFSSFLKISISNSSAIVELLLGSVLLSLLVSPWLIARFSARSLTTTMCLIAGLACLSLASMFWTAPRVATREVFVFVLLPVIGFSFASLAPIAQTLTGWGGEWHSKLMTGVWAVSMPVAFLITPQLVRVIAPRYGIEVFFAGFAIIAFLLILAIWMIKDPTRAVKLNTLTQPKSLLIPAIITLATFELMTVLVNMSGISSVLTLGAMALFLIVLSYLVYVQMTTNSHIETNSDATRVLAFLFLINIATTGFYDNAYLVLHLCSNTLVADRTTFGALAQVSAAISATAIMARFSIQRELMVLGAVVTAVGLGSYTFYFSHPFYEVYIGSKVITGFGMGLLTTAAIFSVIKTIFKGASLSLFIAFVILIGTETGLEMFEIFLQIADIAKISTDATFMAIFYIQVVLVLIAIPVLLVHKPHYRLGRR